MFGTLSVLATAWHACIRSQPVQHLGEPTKLAKRIWSHPSRTRAPTFCAGLRSQLPYLWILQQALLAYNCDQPYGTYHHTHHCLYYLRRILMCDPAHTLEMGSIVIAMESALGLN
ncbi:uncharacterized protein HD556DRAFT_171334 [Suillus plorans]|uniref:Uncharacterized protein n=1 Tax=Suillus plorans TaxID=116603 RepID=A0A9P7A9F1_9AGAM|nr:uncharacterized protein HD556DRAFT_171334 [Suillus plorans]KAG1784960.1 hypothetical protein HD556DRAFT_171334 [Suillus plorans]